ncbi:lipid II flippase MurJ [Romboutsia sp.]|uniref:lipid II flippase MurJ n=1 Tax=Romboutsia sp. TaxID=1965302 RepID=UPI003F38B20C
MKNNMSKVVKSALVLMIVTMLSKILGFGRELVLTSTYGANLVSDVYITTVGIPTILFAEPLVKIFAINFEGEKLKLAITFTRIMIFGVLFIGLSNMMTAWLQINGKFAIAGMVGLPFNIAIIGGILLSTNGNINIMAIGSLLSMASMFLFQLPFAIKSGYKYKLYINLKDENIKKMLGLLIPVFIGVGVNQINSIVDRSLASTLGDGYITVLNSANRLNKLSNDENKEEFIKSVYKSINSVVILILPISVGAIVLAEPVVRIILFASITIGTLIYGMLIIMLKVEEVSIITNMFKKKLKIDNTKTPSRT